MKFRLSAQKLPRLTERQVTGACLDLLRLRGYWIIRQHSALVKTPDNRWMRLGEVGLPDYAAVHRVHPGFLLELKRPGGALRPEQERKIAELQQGYGVAIAVVDSVESLMEFIDRHEQLHKTPPQMRGP